MKYVLVLEILCTVIVGFPSYGVYKIRRGEVDELAEKVVKMADVVFETEENPPDTGEETAVGISEDCPECGSSDTEIFDTTEDVWKWKCKQCGNVFEAENKKRKIANIAVYAIFGAFLLFWLFVSASLFTGCSSIKANDADIIAGNSQATGRLEATVEGLDRTIDSSRKRIGDVIETSRGIEDGIERLEYLFDCYEREVEFLQREIERIRKEAENAS